MRGFYSTILLAFLLSACSEHSSQESDKQWVEDSNIDSFAMTLAEAINESDSLYLNKVLDLNFLVNKFSNEFKKGNPTEDLNYIKSDAQRQFIDLLKGFSDIDYTTHFSYQGAYFQNGIKKLVFSYYNTNIEFDFIEIYVQGGDNSFQIIDLYDYYFGVSFTDLVLDHIRNLRKYGRNKGLYVKSLNQLDLTRRNINLGLYEAAWNNLELLSNTFKHQDPFIRIRLNVAKLISYELYIQELKEFLERRGSRFYGGYHLHKIRINFWEQEVNKARDHINALKQNVSNNTLINILEGNSFFYENNYENALKNYNEAISMDENFFLSYLSKLELLIVANRYSEASELILQLVNEKAYDMDFINEYISIYPEFLKSPNYQELNEK